MSLYAIPGLMTAPTAPKLARRLTMSARGALAAVVWQVPSPHLPVSARIVRRGPLGTYDTLFNDAAGAAIFRERTATGYDYVFRLTTADIALPCGDLELWIQTPDAPKQVWHVYVPELVLGFVVDTSPAVIELPAETAFGLFDLPLNATAVRVPFPTTLNSVPTWVMVNVVNTVENPPEMPVLIPVVSGYDTHGLSVVLSSAVPQSGLQLSWSVATKTVTTTSRKTGQFVVQPGAQSYTVTFDAAFASLPVAFVTLQTTVDENAGLLGYSLQQVSPTGFTLALTAPAPAAFMFNWQATV